MPEAKKQTVQPVEKKSPLLDDHMRSSEVRSGARIFGWVVVVVLVLGAFVAGYFVNASLQNRTALQTPGVTSTPIGQKPNQAALSTLPAGTVTWENTPKEVPVTFFTANMDPAHPHRQWQVGTVTGESAWKGADVLLVRGNALEPNGNSIFLRVLRHNGVHTVLTKQSNPYVAIDLGEGVTLADKLDAWHVASGTMLAPDLMIDELDFNAELHATKEQLVFSRAGDSAFEAWSPFTPIPEEGMGWMGDMSQYEPAVQVKVRRSSGAADTVQLYREKDVKTGNYYVRLPDGTYFVYRLQIPFMVSSPTGDVIAVITWNTGEPNTQGYSAFEAGGCGFTSLRISDGVTLSKNSDFTAVGKITPGLDAGGNGLIYAYRDRNQNTLKEMYENGRAAYEYRHPDVKLTYQDFLATNPIIFWQDPFGRVYELHNDEYASAAECGKPVIYLYPQQTQKVNVQVQPAGGFSVTEPLYPTGGWNVIAEPSGRLTDTRDNTNWSYLFWEGKGSIVGTPESRGFVVARAEVPAFLERSLTTLGLNTQERKDFTEFWVPRMQSAPYYFVTFYGNELMNRIAPLRVTPRPDTTIRILMDYKPLTERKTVEPLPITTPTREGFTVVEWGGVLR